MVEREEAVRNQGGEATTTGEQPDNGDRQNPEDAAYAEFMQNLADDNLLDTHNEDAEAVGQNSPDQSGGGDNHCEYCSDFSCKSLRELKKHVLDVHGIYEYTQVRKYGLPGVTRGIP